MNILLIIGAYFPYGEATSIRAQYLCKIFKEIGYHTHVICDYTNNEYFEESTYENINIKENSKGFFTKGIKCLYSVKEYCKNHDVDIIITNAKSDRLKLLIKFAHSKNIPIVVENCEWYDSSSYKFQYIDYRYITNQIMMNHTIHEADGYINISNLLDNHNSINCKPHIIIPTILDDSSYYLRKSTPNKEIIKLIYAGRPGKSKELLSPIVTAVNSSDYLKEHIELSIFGPSKKEICNNIGCDFKYLEENSWIKCFGKIDHSKLIENYLNSDYMIFLRPNRRSSDAGFPTKLGEAMMIGLPVITNNTGDINLYINNGFNGFIINEITQDNLINLFEQLYKVDNYKKISENAYFTAKKYFYYKQYVNLMKDFLNEVKYLY